MVRGGRNDIDDILESYSNEDHPTNHQTSRAMTAMIAKIQNLSEKVEELRENAKEENSARIQIMQTRERTFVDWVQFGVTIFLGIIGTIIALLELIKHVG